jgi:hypothetical protein
MGAFAVSGRKAAINRPVHFWTPEQEALATSLFERNDISDLEFEMRVGRTREATYSRMRLIRQRQNPGIRKNEHRAEKASAKPTAAMLEDARRRAKAMRSISAFVFGDPAPEYSALNRRI